MKETRSQMEPGLQAVFRIFAWAELGLFFFSFFPALLNTRAPGMIRVFRFPLVSLGLILILIIYLHWKWLEKKLAKWYFPLGIALVFVEPLLMPYIGIRDTVFRDLSINWQPQMLLFVPIVLLAWQYHFRYVMAFILSWAGLELLQWALVSEMYDIFNPLRNVWGIIFRFISYIFIGYIVSRLVEAQREQRNALRQANLKLVERAGVVEELATSRERNRLSRELHDTLAHTLSGLSVQLDAITSIWQPPPKAQAMLDTALETARTGLDETRRALQDLRSSRLEDIGLVMALRSLEKDFSGWDDHTIHLDLPSEDIQGLPEELEQCFYRVAKEALANATRYAEADNITIGVSWEENLLKLWVIDDGKGFDPSKSDKMGTLGLIGMQERAEQVGAALAIESTPGGGTTIRLSVEVENVPAGQHKPAI